MTPFRRGVLAVFVLVAAAAAGCDGPAPVAAPERPSAGLLGAQNPLSLLACTPQPAESASAVIGPAGGTLAVGPHTLVVPAGALDSAVTITAVAPSDSVNRIEFQPQGLRFQQPASLTMSYANCGVGGALGSLAVVYTDDSLNILETLFSTPNPFAQSVTGQLWHFSDYAIAW